MIFQFLLHAKCCVVRYISYIKGHWTNKTCPILKSTLRSFGITQLWHHYHYMVIIAPTCTAFWSVVTECSLKIINTKLSNTVRQKQHRYTKDFLVLIIFAFEIKGLVWPVTYNASLDDWYMYMQNTSLQGLCPFYCIFF